MRKSHGFTLIELMIVVVVIAILAAISFPAYSNFVVKAKRADAHDALLRVQVEQEKFRANNPEYAGGLADLPPIFSQSNDLFLSPEQDYSINITAASATGFTVVAIPRGSQLTRDTACPDITLTMAAGTVTRTPAACW